MLGILLIDKPAGCTSHDVVDRLRRTFQTRRIGHAGTLDPLATGLLVIAVGPATRFLQYLPLEPKEYVGQIQFGQTSTTYDLEGELSEPTPLPADFAERLVEATDRYLGLIHQLPPLYSAVKVGGKPLYKYARKGEDVPREPRTVFIEALEVSDEGSGRASLRVVCSGGTYVRTLADDLGQAVGCGAYLSQLRRIRAGRFCVEEAVALEHAASEHLIPLESALAPMPVAHLNEVQTAAVRHGRRIGWPAAGSNRHIALKAHGAGVIGIARVEGDELQPECVLPEEAPHG